VVALALLHLSIGSLASNKLTGSGASKRNAGTHALELARTNWQASVQAGQAGALANKPIGWIK